MGDGCSHPCPRTARRARALIALSANPGRGQYGKRMILVVHGNAFHCMRQIGLFCGRYSGSSFFLTTDTYNPSTQQRKSCDRHSRLTGKRNPPGTFVPFYIAAVLVSGENTGDDSGHTGKCRPKSTVACMAKLAPWGSSVPAGKLRPYRLKASINQEQRLLTILLQS